MVRRPKFATFELLEMLLLRLRGSYAFNYKQHLPIIKKAEKLLKRI